MIRRCLTKLPPRLAQAFLLFEQQELSAENIGKTLDATTTNVGVMLYRARSALRHCLERHWFGPKVAGKR